jgi:hypothetical protein
MRKNMGYEDRSLRAVAGVILAGVAVAGVVPTPWSIVAGVVAAALLLTSILGRCPAYLPLHLSTQRPSDRNTP